jgi:hypothetical protein
MNIPISPELLQPIQWQHIPQQKQNVSGSAIVDCYRVRAEDGKFVHDGNRTTIDCLEGKLSSVLSKPEE